MASSPESPGPCRPHTFRASGHPTGFDRIAFCQLGGRARERGLSCGQRGRFTGGRSALAPAPAGRPPMRKAYHVKPSVCFQVFSRQTASRSRLAILIAGEPPETRFPWAASFNPSAGSGFKLAANPSPIAVTAAAKAPAAPAPQLLRLRPAGRFRSPSDFLLLKKSIRLRVRRIIFPGVGVY